MWKYALSVTTALLVSATQGAAQSSRFTAAAGGGLTTPLNPTGAYAGLNGNFVAGAGYNVTRSGAVIGEFLWAGLPPNGFAVHPETAPFGRMNLYSLTVNYRQQFDRINGSPFGLYFIGGGGWYYRYASVDKDYVMPPGTVCQPVYTWWGYACDSSGYVYSERVAYKGSSAGGLNMGLGFTIRVSDSDLRFFTESRYHYAFTERIPSTLVTVTFGFRLN